MKTPVCLLLLPVWMDSLRWPFTAMRWCLLTAVCTGCLQPSTAAPVPSQSTTFLLTGRTAPWSFGEHQLVCNTSLLTWLGQCVLIVYFCIPSSQTYSANEIKMALMVEDNHTLEWVDIDPEAFTGRENPIEKKRINNIQLPFMVPNKPNCQNILRKWRVGHQTQASQEADKHSIQSG